MKTKNEIQIIKQYLQEEHGEVKPEWELIIQLLGDNIEQYKAVKKELDRTGLFDQTTFKKNPLLATLKDLQATMLKQIQHLGLSPYATGKITSKDEDTTEDFIQALTD